LKRRFRNQAQIGHRKWNARGPSCTITCHRDALERHIAPCELASRVAALSIRCTDRPKAREPHLATAAASSQATSER